MSLFRPGPREGDRHRIAGVEVVLKVNRRARRVSIRLDGRTGQVVATAPTPRHLDQALAFARSRADWIAERAARRPPVMALRPGQTIPLEGRPTRLTATGTAGAARLLLTGDGPVIASGGEDQAYARRVLALLRRLARERLAERTAFHVAALGLAVPAVSLGDPKSRWGSCTPQRGTIRYSWRLILAPPEVLDYVAAHEVAHLVRADHSPEFWAVVDGLIGDYRPLRAWLKTHGAALHSIG